MLYIKFRLKIWFYIFSAIFLLAGCATEQKKDLLYQVSTFGALAAGDYDGQGTILELSKQGDFGIGTFQGLDGEMILLNGDFFQVKANGEVLNLSQASGIPFAQVTYFTQDKVFIPSQELDYRQLTQYLDKLLPTKNIFFAIKIEGIFKYVQTRSVYKQTKPYLQLSQAVLGQKIFDSYNLSGTIVGWRSPKYLDTLTVPNYHFHFISADRKFGGHLLDFKTQEVKIKIDEIPNLYLGLSKTQESFSLDLESLKEKTGKIE